MWLPWDLVSPESNMSYYHHHPFYLRTEQTRVWFQVSFPLSLSILQRDPCWNWRCWLPRHRYSNPGCGPFLALLCAEAASSWGGWCATHPVERCRLHSQKQVCNTELKVHFFEPEVSESAGYDDRLCGQSESPGKAGKMLEVNQYISSYVIITAANF